MFAREVRHAGNRTTRANSWLLAAVLLGGTGSCGSKGSVAVTAVIQDAAVAVDRPSPLAARLTGSFTLHVDLGPVAPSGTDVSLSQGNFNLVRAAEQSTLVVLKLTAEPLPPYHLEPGGSVDVKLTIADQPGVQGQLVTDEVNPICQAREAVQIAGSITDTASGQPTPVSSSPFAVTGCE